MVLRNLIDLGNETPVILVIENDSVSRNALTTYLEKQACKIVTSDTGQQGLQQAALSSPNLILLGDLAPAEDCFDICQELTTAKHTKHIPVIILSGHTTLEHKVEAFEAGAVDCVTKPFENDALLLRIATYLRLNKNNQDHERDSQNTPPSDQKLAEEIRGRKRAEESLRDSEEKFRSLADHALIGVFIIDHNHRYTYVNDRYCHLLGYSPEELIGFDFRTPIDEKQQFIIDLYWQHYQGTLAESRQEFNILQRGGEKRRVELISTVVKDAKGQTRTMGQLLDVTDRQKAKEKLRYQANLLQQVSDAIIATDLEFNIQSWNKAAEKIYGWTVEEVIGQQMGQVIPTHYLYDEADEVRAQFFEDGFWAGEVIQIDRNGQNLNIFATVSYLKDKNGNPIGVVAANKDITHHKQTETNKALLQGIINNSKAVIHAKDLEGHFILINRQGESLFNVKHDDFIGKTDYDFFPEEIANGFRLKDRQIIASGEAQLLEEEVSLPDGPRTYVTLKFPLHDLMGRIYGTAGISTDITQWKQAELELRSNREMLALSQEMANLGSWEWNISTDEMTWSEEMCRIHGVTPEQFPSTFTQALEFIHSDDRFMIEYRLKNISTHRRSVPFEYRIVQPDGNVRNVVSNGQLLLNNDQQPLCVIGTCLDITERKQIEMTLQVYSENLEAMVESRTAELKDTQAKLVRKEKLAFLGELAGGVGHELRNPLGVISNAIFYLKMIQPEATEPVKNYLDIIASRVQEAERIIADLLSLSRTRKTDKTAISIKGILTEIWKHHPTPSNITVKLDYPPDLPQVSFDELHLKQILTNLLINAYQAMPEGGTLTIHPHIELQTIKLSISDTGVGILKDELDKIFEPLFTTKSKGIGLGLAVVKNLTELNDGSIAVESKEGQGTTFILTLPKSEAN